MNIEELEAKIDQLENEARIDAERLEHVRKELESFARGLVKTIDERDEARRQLTRCETDETRLRNAVASVRELSTALEQAERERDIARDAGRKIWAGYERLQLELDATKAELASMSDVLMLAQSERADLRERVELLQAQRSEALDLLEELDDARARELVESLNAMTGWTPPAPAPPREPNDADRTAETLAQAIEDFAGGGLTVTVTGSELRLSPGPPPVCVPEVES